MVDTSFGFSPFIAPRNGNDNTDNTRRPSRVVEREAFVISVFTSRVVVVYRLGRRRGAGSGSLR